MANVAGKLVMRLLTLGISIPVGIATKKAVEGVWAGARTADTPRKPSDSGVRWGDAIGWAALSAVGVVVADLVTRRGAEEVWRTVMGTEPPAKVDKSTEPAEGAGQSAPAKKKG